MIGNMALCIHVMLPYPAFRRCTFNIEFVYTSLYLALWVPWPCRGSENGFIDKAIVSSIELKTDVSAVLSSDAICGMNSPCELF